jgi:tRNA pseudouridine32 synthase / 23S rRNA pseudouridine746 synthase
VTQTLFHPKKCVYRSALLTVSISTTEIFNSASIPVVYQDHALLVVLKPSGLLSVPGRGADKQDCAALRVRLQCSDALVVHRLDMATSGLMLFARGLAAQRVLGQAFERREVGKQYVAVVGGVVAQDQGVIAWPLLTDWPNRPLQKIDLALGKPALTHYTVLARDAVRSTSRLLLEPATGRTHQLRVHLLSIGHPILGDALYAPPSVRELSPRLLLHASRLQLAHPETGLPLCLEDTAPF